MFVGSIVGAVVTGVAIAFTASPLCALIAPVFFLLGGVIGKEIKRPEKKK